MLNIVTNNQISFKILNLAANPRYKVLTIDMLLKN